MLLLLLFIRTTLEILMTLPLSLSILLSLLILLIFLLSPVFLSKAYLTDGKLQEHQNEPQCCTLTPKHVERVIWWETAAVPSLWHKGKRKYPVDGIFCLSYPFLIATVNPFPFPATWQSPVISLPPSLSPAISMCRTLANRKERVEIVL